MVLFIERNLLIYHKITDLRHRNTDTTRELGMRINIWGILTGEIWGLGLKDYKNAGMPGCRNGGMAK